MGVSTTELNDPPAGTLLTLQLWTAVLLAPIAWAAHLTVGYALATLNCDASSLPLHAMTAVALTLAAAGGALGWSLTRQLHDGPGIDEARLERRRFMAGGGIILSLLFGFAILVQSMPVFLLRPCE